MRLTAQAEGFEAVAGSFTEIGEVEEYHERRFHILAERVTKEEIFKRPQPIKWKCRNCGYVHEGAEAPEVCPACRHARAYCEPWAENY